MISIYTLTSQLHDKQAVAESTQEFLSALDIDYEMKGANYADYGQNVLSLIYVRTGGTEGILRPMLPELQRTGQPFYLLTSGSSNSLAASMEILSYLQQQGLAGEILHGTPQYITRRIQLLERVEKGRRQLRGSRLGIVGKPSDWLISSFYNRETVRQRAGIQFVDIPMDKVIKTWEQCDEDMTETNHFTEENHHNLPGAQRIYLTLKKVVEQHRLQGFTIRCFDLLNAVHNTGCVALARLNSEGLVAGCEGDVPAALSMMICRVLLGVSGFQANPARIDPETGEVTLAHCTIPLDMVERFELDTHFESGIGVGIRGYMPLGDVTLFKVSGDLSHHFVAEGTLIRNEAQPNLCRTQQVIQLNNPEQARYFLTRPIGNHHIVVPGHQRELLEEMLKSLNS